MLSMKCFIIKKNLQIMYQYYNKLTKIIKKILCFIFDSNIYTYVKIELSFLVAIRAMVNLIC